MPDGNNAILDGGGAGAARSVNLIDLTNQQLPDKATREVTPPLVRVGLRLPRFMFGLICTSTAIIFVVAFKFTVDPPGTLYYFDSASIEQYQRAVGRHHNLSSIIHRDTW